MIKGMEFGALVVSLDFELIWGMRDICDMESPYALKIINGRRAIPRILELFHKYNIAATWATVGLLFAESQAEMNHYSPQIKPDYKSLKLNPYNEKVGIGEVDDPFHYAPQLIQYIQQYRRQEIATHTFSHYYCLEEGQTPEMFSADLNSSIIIAKKHGVHIRSIVFPRNLHNPSYDEILLNYGLRCYRGSRHHPMYQYGSKGHHSPVQKAYRLLDSFLNFSGNHTIAWNEIKEESGLCNVRESFFLRPTPRILSVMNDRRIKRITMAMKEAAEQKKILHLWWHPHNFGSNIERNMNDLKIILEHFQTYKETFGFVSLNMGEVADIELNGH